MRVVAIDGPAGSGKTTVAKALASKLGLEHLNTGAMYRAVAFAVLRAGGDPADEAFVTAVARNTRIIVEGDKVTVDGIDATMAVRHPDVTHAVSAVAAIAGVREELVAAQRSWARKRGGGVLEGRDIGTAVFPDAAFKAYLTVHPSEGARRRALQEGLSHSDGSRDSDGSTADRSLIAGTSSTASRLSGDSDGFTADRSDADSAGTSDVHPRILEAVAADLARRNHADATRATDPLRVDADAVVVDTTGITCEETIDMLFEYMKSAGIGADTGMTSE